MHKTCGMLLVPYALNFLLGRIMKDQVQPCAVCETYSFQVVKSGISQML